VAAVGGVAPCWVVAGRWLGLGRWLSTDAVALLFWSRSVHFDRCSPEPRPVAGGSRRATLRARCAVGLPPGFLRRDRAPNGLGVLSGSRSRGLGFRTGCAREL